MEIDRPQFNAITSPVRKGAPTRVFDTCPLPLAKSPVVMVVHRISAVQHVLLAIEVNGRVTIYDTLDHQISGFSQQQSSGGSLTFSSQHGLVDVATLPVLSVDGVPRHVRPDADAVTGARSVGAPSVGREADVFATIEKLAELRDKGILSEEEFATKKAELLARL